MKPLFLLLWTVISSHVLHYHYYGPKHRKAVHLEEEAPEEEVLEEEEAPVEEVYVREVVPWEDNVPLLMKSQVEGYLVRDNYDGRVLFSDYKNTYLWRV